MVADVSCRMQRSWRLLGRRIRKTLLKVSIISCSRMQGWLYFFSSLIAIFQCSFYKVSTIWKTRPWWGFKHQLLLQGEQNYLLNCHRMYSSGRCQYRHPSSDSVISRNLQIWRQCRCVQVFHDLSDQFPENKQYELIVIFSAVLCLNKIQSAFKETAAWPKQMSECTWIVSFVCCAHNIQIFKRRTKFHCYINVNNCRYEAEGRYRKQIEARRLWEAIITAQIETGVPYMVYKVCVQIVGFTVVSASLLVIVSCEFWLTDSHIIQHVTACIFTSIKKVRSL